MSVRYAVGSSLRELAATEQLYSEPAGLDGHLVLNVASV
jgi:hypothetical protein